MPDNGSKQRDWIDIGLRAATPLIVGIVIAWVGLFGDETLTKISNQQESARLLTELQIKREQAESSLRKDIFAQALEAFLLKGRSGDGRVQKLSLREMSKQLLRLELLALNFGDSLSLSPLFSEMRKDLSSAKPIENEEMRDYKERKFELLTRLNSLAQRVASAQLSSLEKRGVSKEIDIPLYEYKALLKEGGKCSAILLEDNDFAWPADDILWQMGELDENYKPVVSIASVNEGRSSDFFRNAVEVKSLIDFQGISRYIEVHVSEVDHCKKSARVQIFIKRKNPESVEADPEFGLDYFNFPMVDNTRLSDNHRFAIVAEKFRLNPDNPSIKITAVVFPSEYASLRDKPGMEEVRRLLESALKNGNKQE
jgi:hypothetical protein